MRPHVTIRFASGTEIPTLPHWSEVVDNPSLAQSQLYPAVDAVFQRHRIPILATREYPPAGREWTPEEIASGLNRVYRAVLLSEQELPSGIVDEIRLVPEVETAQLGAVGSMPIPVASALGRDRRTDWAREAIYLDEAHGITRGSRSVVVAVLDTGVDTDHPELADVMLPGRDFVDVIDGAADFIGDYLDADEDPNDQVGHGTHVAGIIAGAGRHMPAGVAPNIRILPVRVLAAMRRGDEVRGAGLVDNINVGVKWAVDNGANVINMSLGVPHTGGGLPHHEVVEYARRKGVTIVAASGNDGTDREYYPGALAHVVTVGAVGQDSHAAPFSSYGRHVDLVAPGTAIYSSTLDGDYAFATGTSHAAPFVAGAVALMKSHAASRGRRFSDRSCKRALRATADRPGRRMRDIRYGFGRVNALDALRYVTHELDRMRRI